MKEEALEPQPSVDDPPPTGEVKAETEMGDPTYGIKPKAEAEETIAAQETSDVVDDPPPTGEVKAEYEMGDPTYDIKPKAEAEETIAAHETSDVAPKKKKKEKRIRRTIVQKTSDLGSIP